jgi:hypothetical protein
VPTRVLRRVALLGLLHGLALVGAHRRLSWFCTLALAQHRLQPRDVLADVAQQHRVLELLRGGAEAQAEAAARRRRRALGALALDDLALHRKLGGRQLQGARPGLHTTAPIPRGCPCPCPCGSRRLLGDRLVREDADPDLAAALDVARHRDTGRLDLPVGDPARLQRLQAVVAERHVVAAGGQPLRMRPLICLRNLTLRISMVRLLLRRRSSRCGRDGSPRPRP